MNTWAFVSFDTSVPGVKSALLYLLVELPGPMILHFFTSGSHKSVSNRYPRHPNPVQHSILATLCIRARWRKGSSGVDSKRIVCGRWLVVESPSKHSRKLPDDVPSRFTSLSTWQACNILHWPTRFEETRSAEVPPMRPAPCAQGEPWYKQSQHTLEASRCKSN